MKYEDFLITLSDISAEQAYEILYDEPNHKYKSGYELVISKHPQYSYYYAKDVIKDRFKLAEENISKDPKYSYYYAKDVIKGRWKKAEETISKDPIYRKFYAEDVMHKKINI